MCERNEKRVSDRLCSSESDDTVSKLKEGLVQHQERIQRPLKHKVRFKCDVCGEMYETEVACKMQNKSSEGGCEIGIRSLISYMC